MGTVILYTLRESFHRRMGIVLMVTGLLVTSLLLWAARFETHAEGSVNVLLWGKPEGPANKVAERLVQEQLQFSGGPWLILGIFAAAPLLTSFLEKGWVDMLLSKGVPRWQMLLGRYLGALAVFAGSLVFFIGIPVLQFWVGGGVPPGRIFFAAGIVVCSFAAILATMTLVSVQVPNPAIPIMLGFLQMMLAPLLERRREMLYDFITAEWARWLIDWAYRILPKHTELQKLATDYYRTGNLEWWPIWSGALFLLAVLVLASWLLHRESF